MIVGKILTLLQFSLVNYNYARVPLMSFLGPHIQASRSTSAIGEVIGVTSSRIDSPFLKQHWWVGVMYACHRFYLHSMAEGELYGRAVLLLR